MSGAVARLFEAGWRVFFLAAGLEAIVAIAVWLLWLGTPALESLPVSMPPAQWHAHEMIFGLPSAAFAGFFLTAVPNWTGTLPARRVFIAAAAAVWLAGRIAVWWSGYLPGAVVALADLAFLPILASKVASQLARRPKPQNLMFLGLLGLVWTGDLMVHLDWIGVAATADRGLRLGLLATACVIAVLGGRVTPAFTRNELMRRGRMDNLPATRPRLDMLGIAAAIATALAVLLLLPGPVCGALALAAGVLQFARLAGWRTLAILGDPLVWSLHLGWGMLALGYLVLGAAWLGFGSEIGALHLMGIGAVGGMILAVASRATLGHSGRPLAAPAAVALAYALLPGAAALRYAAAALPETAFTATFAAGALWCVAFSFYLAALWPAFWGPRAAPDPAE